MGAGKRPTGVNGDGQVGGLSDSTDSLLPEQGDGKSPGSICLGKSHCLACCGGKKFV